MTDLISPDKTMRIEKIKTDKKRYLDLLLLGDESEAMIDRYLERGDMYALFDGDLKSLCVITKEENGTHEIKNIATSPQYQGQGYGKTLIRYLSENHAKPGDTMMVGTGNTPKIIRFYTGCGFSYSHTLPDFFTDHYPEPIVEDGIQLIDMIYLKKTC